MSLSVYSYLSLFVLCVSSLVVRDYESTYVLVAIKSNWYLFPPNERLQVNYQSVCFLFWGERYGKRINCMFGYEKK